MEWKTEGWLRKDGRVTIETMCWGRQPFCKGNVWILMCTTNLLYVHAFPLLLNTFRSNSKAIWSWYWMGENRSLWWQTKCGRQGQKTAGWVFGWGVCVVLVLGANFKLFFFFISFLSHCTLLYSIFSISFQFLSTPGWGFGASKSFSSRFSPFSI